MTRPHPVEGRLPESGPCEGIVLVPTHDDAVVLQCAQPGRRVVETDEFGHKRTRIACPACAIDMENAPS